MSRSYDPETDQDPTGGGESGDVERPGREGSDDPIPVPPGDPVPARIEEPPDAPNVPDEPNPGPIGDPSPKEPTRLV
jgi:hypothetical protein